MNRSDLEQYCKDNGVPYRLVGDQIRVMDLTQLPENMRSDFDERGLFAVNDSTQAAVAEVSEVSEAELTGRLPEDFPGRSALEVEGITTYAKVRKRLSDLTGIPGIGDATADKIQAAMGESSEGEESE